MTDSEIKNDIMNNNQMNFDPTTGQPINQNNNNIQQILTHDLDKLITRYCIP